MEKKSWAVTKSKTQFLKKKTVDFTCFESSVKYKMNLGVDSITRLTRICIAVYKALIKSECSMRLVIEKRARF